VGSHLTAVKTKDRLGLSATVHPPGHKHGSPTVSSPGELAGKTLQELAGLLESTLPMESGIAMAAVNAGLPAQGLDLEEMNGLDLLKRKAEDMNLVMVGHFNFTHQLTPVTRSTYVLELDPQKGDLPASAAERVIPEANVVAITGSSFANRTIEPLLEASRNKWVMVIGPTSPLSPVLFDYGVDAIAGCQVAEVESTFRQVSEGAIFRQLAGARRVLLTRD